MRHLAALTMIAACGGGDDYAIDPNHPPGMPPGGTIDAWLVLTDAGFDAGVDAAPTMVAGRVCLYVDARAPTTCQQTGAGGLKVTLGTTTASTMATTAADGTFSIAVPAGTPTSFLWHVSDPTLETSVMRYAEGKLIPAISITNYALLEDNNGVASNDVGTGAVIARITIAGAPIKGATATASPQQLYAPFYDGTNPQVWLQAATGAAGVAWFPDASLGTLTVTATYMTQHAAAMLPIEDQSITYTVLDLP